MNPRRRRRLQLQRRHRRFDRWMRAQIEGTLEILAIIDAAERKAGLR